MDYHTWGFPVFFLEDPLWGGMVGPPKQEPIESTGVYFVHSKFNAVSLNLILNIINGHISTHYHVFFNDTLSTVQHMRKSTVPNNLEKPGRVSLR